MNPRSFCLTRSFAGILYVAFVLLVSSSAAFAQNGKIKAKVVDAKTGEPLIHATVQIVETKQGAYTKDDGFAIVTNVSPSEQYHVIAKYAGYNAQTIESVKVRADETTQLTFKLSSHGQDTIIVSSDRIMVSKTNTQVGRKFTESQVINTPGRQRLDEIIRLTPGIYTDASSGGLSINGSRGTSNSVRINNVETSDPISGRTSALQNGLSKFAVSEVDVTTAGGDASKGGYTGGVINTQTKAGGENFEFNLHYRGELASLFGYSGNGLKQLGQGEKTIELALGGPIVDNLSYYVTSRGYIRDFYNNFVTPVLSNQGLDVRDPVGNSGGQLPRTNDYSRSVTAKLSYNVPGFSLIGDVDLASESRLYNSVTTFYSDYANLPASNDIQNLYSLNGRAQIGDGVIQFDAAYLTRDYGFGKYDQSQSYGLFSLYKLYQPDDKYTWDDNNRVLSPAGHPDGIIDIYAPVSREIPDPTNPTQVVTLTAAGLNPITGHIEGPAIANSTSNPYGLLGAFIIAGNDYGYQFEHTQQIQFDANYNTQIGGHLLNAGVEGHFYHVAQQDNQLPFDANPFKDSFDVHPYYGALFVEDKMEFSDITFQPGIRFDFYNPGSSTNITNLFDPVHTNIVINPDGSRDTITTYSIGKAPLQTQLSPRLGITYAVTEQTTFNFNYDWNFKDPLLTDVLTNTSGNLQQIFARGNQIIGNGALKAERTKEIRVGFNTQLSDVFAVGLEGVYKDLRNHAGLSSISGPLLAQSYTIYTDDEYGNVRSLQLTLEKRMSNNYSARVNYTYSVAKGTSSSAEANYQSLINVDPTAEQAVLPLQPFYLDYDRTHVAQLILDVNFQRGEGPTIFGTKLLQNFDFSSTTEYQSGVPYTRRDLRGVQIGEYNGDREPAAFYTDAQLTRSIPFGDLFGESMKNTYLDLTIEVTNLFNQVTALSVYPTTGQGDDDGSNPKFLGTAEYYNNPTTQIIQQFGPQYDAFGKLYYNPRADLNHDGKVSLDEQQKSYDQLRHDGFARRTNYQTPRRVYFNVGLRF